MPEIATPASLLAMRMSPNSGHWDLDKEFLLCLKQTNKGNCHMHKETVILSLDLVIRNYLDL